MGTSSTILIVLLLVAFVIGSLAYVFFLWKFMEFEKEASKYLQKKGCALYSKQIAHRVYRRGGSPRAAAYLMVERCNALNASLGNGHSAFCHHSPSTRR